MRDLIGGASPMRQHCAGRLCAVDIMPGGSATLAPPQADEDLLAYVTDGAGTLDSGGGPISLGQYDVFIARPNVPALNVASASEPLRLLTFYLPRFVPRERQPIPATRLGEPT